MNLPAVRPGDAPAVLSPPSLPAVTPAALRQAAPLDESAHQIAGSLGNLSAAAKPVYEALQAAGSLPPAADPTFVLPANGDFFRLFSAIQAAQAERIYPAPIFSFSA